MPRRVIVTGGAKRIGAAIVRGLAEHGHAVAIHCHSSGDEADALVRELRDKGFPCAAICADLADTDATKRLIPAAREVLGGSIQGLVNCASVFEYDAMPLKDLDLLTALTRVNLGAPLLLASAMAQQDDLDDGAIVNVLDQKVANLNPDFLSYSCTKIALEGATTMLAQALAPRIRVNALSPGLTLPSGDQSDEEFEQVARENLLRRRVDIADIARTANFLLTTPSITGQNVFVDCGQRFVTRDGDVMFENRDRQ